MNVRDNIFQNDELVDTYQVALFTNLEENLIFHVVENIFIDVDIKKKNNLLKINKHI